MNLLAIDASTEACAVGILRSDGELFEAFEVAPRKHTELIPLMLNSVIAESGLAKTDLDGCISGVGPGAFTGIRIALATIQGIALGLNIPCYAVSSLHAIAQQALFETSLESGELLATIDARMGEVYYASYHFETVDGKQSLVALTDEALQSNDDLSIANSTDLVVGSGVACIQTQLQQCSKVSHIEHCYPTAKSLFQIFKQQSLPALTAEALQASYIRNQVTD